VKLSALYLSRRRYILLGGQTASPPGRDEKQGYHSISMYLCIEMFVAILLKAS